MAYQTPQLVLVGSASTLVLGLGESVGNWSDNPESVHQGLSVGNSRYTQRN